MAKRYGVKTPLIQNAGHFAESFAKNEEHYKRTLEYWKKLKATDIVELVASDERQSA
jgi:hypothetical protein